MNLDIIGNTFVNIRINSHTLHFHQSDWFKLIAIAEFISMVNNRKKYSVKWDRGLSRLAGAVTKISATFVDSQNLVKTSKIG